MIMTRSDADTTSARRAGRKDVLHALVVLVLVGGIAALALDNRQDVQVGWVLGETTMPLYQLFVATFVLGIVAGLVARSRRHHRRSDH